MFPMTSEKPPNHAGHDRPEESSAAPSAGRPRIISSGELLEGQREVWIEHGNEMYRLRLTAAGKLYLTK